MEEDAKISLTDRGYGLVKSALAPGELAELREELTVAPFVPKDFAVLAKPKPFPVFQESDRKIYVPKFYGLQRFGLPSRVQVPEGAPIEVAFAGELRPEQVVPVERFLEACRDPRRMGGILNLPCAFGKCLGKNTPVMMHDGRLVKVQNVRPGDALMGDDSTPRRVLSTCAGRAQLYNVVQENGDAYLANGDHLLSLLCVSDSGSATYFPGQFYDVSIQEYSKLAPDEQAALVGYKRPARFQAKPVPGGDPYQTGFAACRERHPDACLPSEYMANEEHVMEALLRGALDAIGESRVVDGSEVVFVEHPSARLVHSIAFVARALGKTVKMLTFKSLSVQPHPTNVACGVLVTRIRIVQVHVGPYFGFELDGNGRFLLGDCTVTHNTTIAVYAMCSLAKKTLIVVHKEFLLEQWKERIAQFAPTARVGTLRGRVVDVEGKDVVVSLLQSLSMKDYPSEVFKDFGFGIIDECHHTAAEVFSRALKKMTFKYTLGLSATLKRKDGLSKVFVWHLGDVVHAIHRRSDAVEVRLIHFYDSDPAYSKEEKMFGDKLNVTRMINNICDFVPRTRAIVDAVLEVLDQEPERKVLILSDRRAHLGVLKSMFDEAGIASGFYMGGMAQAELKASEALPVILGTFHISHEGLDIRGLDTLVLASPKSDVVQASGRILRDKPEERRHTPLILDVVDGFSIFHGQAKKRAAYYASCKYDIVRTGGDRQQQEEQSSSISSYAFID